MPLNYHVMGADFHLLKRKNSKGKLIYYAAFLSDLPGRNGKKKYRAVKSTGVGSRSAAEKVARNMLVDGKVLSSRETLRDFLLGFWDLENSEYLKTQRADGRVHNSRCVRDWTYPELVDTKLSTIVEGEDHGRDTKGIQQRIQRGCCSACGNRRKDRPRGRE